MRFKLSKKDIKPLKTGVGGCIATKRITVKGKGVNFMYRQKPDHAQGSGWRFFSGSGEDDAYLNDPKNSDAFDVNTIANYAPDIIPYLGSSIGSVFERNQKTGDWEKVTDFTIPA